jgi:polyhydroxyalkanoate synthase
VELGLDARERRHARAGHHARSAGDRRFNDPAWSEEPVFDYPEAGLPARDQAHGRDGRERRRSRSRPPARRCCSTRQQSLHALSPANFPHTNPEAIRRAIDTGSVSLISGLANLLADAATSRASSSAAHPGNSSSASTSRPRPAASSSRTS